MKSYSDFKILLKSNKYIVRRASIQSFKFGHIVLNNVSSFISLRTSKLYIVMSYNFRYNFQRFLFILESNRNLENLNK